MDIKSNQVSLPCLITKNTDQNVNAKKGLISKNQLSWLGKIIYRGH